MGLAHVRKPEGLVSREAQSKARSENAIRKCDSSRRDSQVRSTSAIQNAINRCDSEARFKSAIKRCDSEARFKSAIKRCDSQVRSTGATHKCDRLNRESKNLQVCKFASLKKLESSQVCKFAHKKHKKSKKLFLNESGQFDNECSTINWCLRVVGTLRLLI